jgi:glycosyltransferase involved in cell wall biosynthesis
MDYQGRLGLQQRVLPSYRVPFFDHLATSCRGGLSVYAGLPRPREAIYAADTLQAAAYHPGRNLHLLPGPLYICWQTDLLDWLEAWDPDALIMEANPRYLASRTAMGWMKKRARPVLGWGLGAPPGSGMYARARRGYRERFLRPFDILIAYSERGGQEYVDLGFPPDRIVVAYNSVAAPPQIRPERQPLAGRSARVLFVGRLQNRKRVDLLLRACAQIDPKPDLKIVGEGPARGSLETLAQEIYAEAEFTGALFCETLKQALQTADLVVLPGTGGLAVQQAMAAGLPVIVAEGDGTQNDLVSGDNGWLVTADDLQALTNAMQEALSDPVGLVEMGKASYRLAVERFNIDHMRSQFLKALALAEEVA